MEDRQDMLLQQKGDEAEKTSAVPLDGFLQESYGCKSFQRGDIVEGVIVSKKEGEILVDVGSKSEAIVHSREVELMSAKDLNEIHVGDSVLAYVVRPEDQNGHAVLSLRHAQLEQDWQEAERIYQSREIIKRPVVGFNKGGVIVRLGKVRGFVPASQLNNAPRQTAGNEGTNEESPLASLVGRTLQLMVVELDRKRNRFILSEREALKEERKQHKEKLLTELKEGEIRRGIVTSLCNFGAFVDLGGADGLIHLSELSWGRVSHPSQVVKVGDEIDVRVMKVDRERNRIALSLKKLQPEPWSLVDQSYYVGQLVSGTITKLTDFGAFARLDNGIEGLIHISELSEERVHHPRDVVHEGQTVMLRVVRVDSARRRLGLSLRRAREDYDDLEWSDEYGEGDAS